MIRLFLLIIAFPLITTLGKAQLPSSFDTITTPLMYWRELSNQPSSNLFEIGDLIFDYYGQIQHPELKSGFKDFNRHYMFWKDRVGTNDVNGIGNYQDYIVTADHVSKTFTACALDYANWTSIGPFNNAGQNEGLVLEVFEHPNDPTIRLIGTPTGGIWKLNNSTNTWENVTDNLGLSSIGVNEIVVNPFDDNQLFAASGNYAMGSKYGVGVLVSNDKGITWSIMPGYFYDHFTELMKIIIDENDTDPSDGLTMYAISRNEIFKTTDSGNSWIQLINPNSSMTGLSFFDIISNNSGTIFVSTDGANSTCFYSNDGGNSWNNISTQFGSFTCMRFSSNVETATLYCCFDISSSIRKVAKSTDNGLTWTVLPFQAARNTGDGGRIIEHSSLTGLIYLDLGNNYLRQYNDFGETLNFGLSGPGTGHFDSRDIQFIPSSTGFDKFLRANDGGLSLIEFTNSSAYTFTDLNGPILPIGEFYRIGTSEIDSDLIIAGHIHNGVRKLDNGVWSSIVGGDGHTSEINPYDPNFYYYRVYNTVYRSGFNLFSTATWLGSPLLVDPGNPNFVYFAVGTPALKRLDENTGIISTISNQIIKPSAIGISESSSEIIYLGTGEAGPNGTTFVKSIDFGNNWIDLSNSLVYSVSGNTKRLNEVIGWGYVSEIEVNPLDPNKLWITNSGPYTVNGIPVDEKERVLMSTDGGSSWIDYSEGLSALPAIGIVYQKGTNDRLFVGTDAGVFYRDATMSSWECYSYGLPRCVVVDLDINHCTNELILSSHGRGIWKTPITLPNTNAEKSVSGTWTGKRRIYNNLRVEDGNTLKLDGEFYFGENTGIIVDPGGKLEIDNATLTSACGSWWQGINAMGQEFESQTTVEQPFIKITNSNIENAYIAVRGGKPASNPDQTVPNGGAIVQVNNSTFKNNWIDIQFMPFHRIVTINGNDYELRNLSYVRNSHFITDANLSIPNHIDPLTHIQMTDINGIEFRNNIFESTRTGITLDNAGMGIMALDAKFNVIANCSVILPIGGQCPTPNLDGNEFRNLFAGIYTGQGTGYSNIKVDGNLFEDCVYGMYLGGTNYNTITRNTFKVPQGDDSFIDPLSGYTYKAAFGIYLQSAFGNKIEENIFENANTSGPHRNLGVYAENAGVISGNKVYRNDFTDLTYSVQTAEDNQLLDIDCNRFNKYANTFADIHVATGNLKDQGFCHPIDRKQPQANEFYGTSCDLTNNLQIHLNPQAVPFEYSSYTLADVGCDLNNCSDLPNLPFNYETYCTDFPFNRQLACPSTITTTGITIIPFLRSTIVLERQTVAQLKSQVDGGNTESLLTAINGNMNSGQLKNLLMQYSPYLSDKVLISSINRTNSMSPGHLKQILLDNSPLTEAVLYNLNLRPLPPGHMNQIMNAQVGESARAELDDEIKFHDATKLYALNELVGIYLDTNWVDSAMVALQNDGSMEAICLLLPVASKKDTIIVKDHIEILRDIASEEELWYPLNKTTKELEAFCDFHETLYNIKNRGGSYFSMKTNERQKLLDIAHSLTSVAIYANSVLDFTDNIKHYFPDSPFIYANGTQRLVLQTELVATNTLLKAYPNPFEGMTTIEYDLNDELLNGYLSITDLSGKEVSRIHLKEKNTSLTVNLNTVRGVYLATLYNNEKPIQTIKLVLY